jgi:hypothetical protein
MLAGSIEPISCHGHEVAPVSGCVVSEKKFPPELVRLLSSFEGPAGPSADEGLRLIKAFLRIEDATLRTTVVEIVEKIAAALATKH